ncbi:sigma factor-like helix-turn-helix DNA-binding protein [Streptomyces fagopyri]|uniref:sigma factor-like helix-turn-helix DNA-binding protein n=1 Tax=Streptomyces fagopyri TaxID=2662397 RepID=UPI001D178F25|nr:sigma factor-like helix-turn-helix DNA-binding protein [Streptomyces fagopyri]
MPHIPSDASSDASSHIPAGEGGLPAVTGREGDFTTYAAAAWPRLVRTAHLLTGDLREAEDLVLATLARVRVRWRRIPRDDVAFYVRRSLVDHHLGRARRRRVTRLPASFLPGRSRRPAPDRAEAVTVAVTGADMATAAHADMEAATERGFPGRPPTARSALPALSALSARQRVVLVLRFDEGLGEAETAQLLRCSPGAVRALARRGLEALCADPSFAPRSVALGARS